MKDKILKAINDSNPITISALAKKLKINRIYLSGYLKALEDNGELLSKNIGVAKIYLISEHRAKENHNN
jgi:DNA-binding MarR family transcriptional regulator